MSSPSVTEILKLSPKKRLAVVEAIWDSLAADPDCVPVPASHVREIRRRLAVYEANPVETVSWDEAKASALRKLGK